MSEPQYAHYKNLPRQEMGLMSGETWQRDPKMLGIHLARYKFVAKMLAGLSVVAEIGCGDGFYSKIVKQEVLSLDLFDFDKNLKPNNEKNWYEHDILHSPLHGKYDAIYSLDVMEHISPQMEQTFLKNICSSVIPYGVFIVGMPSLESQKYASEASKIGHVNCMSSDILKSVLQDYFKNVFMFSMNDETLHTGFGPMSHYLLGVCCGVR